MNALRSIQPAEIERLAEESFDELNASSEFPCLLIAEHAGALVPAPWHDLGLDKAMLSTHYAVDIGIDRLTRRLSGDLGAHSLLARYSRLFLDFNRPATEWDFMRPDLGGIPVPANRGLDAADRRLRQQVAWQPLEDALGNASAARPYLISVHSFTPVMGGFERPVDIGVLWKSRTPLVDALLAELERRGPEAGFRIGDNAPYDWRGVTAFTLESHGHEKGRDCLYLEVRNDLLQDDVEFERIAALLAETVRSVISLLESRASRTDP